MYGAGSAQTLDRLTDLDLGLRYRFTLPQRQPEAPIAALVVGTGKNDIAEPGQSHHGFLVGAELHAQTHDFR